MPVFPLGPRSSRGTRTQGSGKTVGLSVVSVVVPLAVESDGFPPRVIAPQLGIAPRTWLYATKVSVTHAENCATVAVQVAGMGLQVSVQVAGGAQGVPEPAAIHWL